MPAKAVETHPAGPGAGALYREDFALWANQTAQLLREGRFSEVDIEHVAEEIQGMGISQDRELFSRLTVLLKHLLKWQYQPEKRSGSWQSTIANQRTELDQLFKRSPSLRLDLEQSVAEAYPAAVKEARYETGLELRTFPPVCPFSLEQILDEDFPTCQQER